METALKVILIGFLVVLAILATIFLLMPALAWISTWFSMNVVVVLFQGSFPALSSLTFESVYALALVQAYIAAGFNLVAAGIRATVEA